MAGEEARAKEISKKGYEVENLLLNVYSYVFSGARRTPEAGGHSKKRSYRTFRVTTQRFSVL